LYDPKQVIGDVTLKVKGEFKGQVTVGELYQYLQRVLQFQGYVMTRSGNLVTVRPMHDVGTVDAPFVGIGTGKARHGDVAVTKTFKLKHINTGTAEMLLNSMQLGIKTASIPETGTLIITGFTYRMARIEELLNLVDKPGKPKKFKSRQLTYTMAESLAPKIKTLAEELGTISITISAAAALPKPQAPARTVGAGKRGKTDADKKKQTSISRRFTDRQSKQAGGAKVAKDTVYLEADARTNSILMIGHEEQLKIVGELINSLDVEQQDLRSLRLYEIVNVDAQEARGKLEELGIISPSRTARGTGRFGRGRGRDTIGRGTAAADRAATATGRAGTGAAAARTGRARGMGYAETEEAPVDEPQVVVIETVNALLVNATAEQHVKIAMIVGYVDLPTRAEDMPYVFYSLENQDPVELAEVLNKLIQETTQQKDKEGKIVQTSTQRRTEEDIVIIPDENTFGLIVYASKKNQQWIEVIIENLDKRRPQVLIDVTLVRITKDDAFNFDLELLSSIPDMGFTSGQVVGVDSTIHDLLRDATDRGKFLDLKSSTGKFNGFYGDHKINALLTAVETKKYGRVMARPKLLVNDNELGTIQTTSTTFVTRTTANVIPGSGTGGTVSTEQTVFEPYDAGITMEITPHISEGDMLRLEISLNRSDFTEDIAPEGGLLKPPNKADEDVTTIITVPDKSTIILGGMDKISHSKGGKKIPILGDLPLIGGLFREVVRSEGHDKLYIFVKAHILRPEGETALADLKDISKKNREAFERLEQEMGEHQDWPGLNPSPMDPLRILEAD
jgi:type II secretory pathway component GspD/PulD (secretin)